MELEYKTMGQLFVSIEPFYMIHINNTCLHWRWESQIKLAIMVQRRTLLDVQCTILRTEGNILSFLIAAEIFSKYTLADRYWVDMSYGLRPILQNFIKNKCNYKC